ncbi:uncharacterized protein LOC142175900 [Nicotiana tabacum]|uniref:Uncharacterized protein LOC142175900 n=1 Tax=Nicotiana tabacum TaxID=4097 RepID=A0AC58TP55_TOBAC
MYNLAKDMSLPWLVRGDFNIIWDEEEKFGGLPVSLNEVNDFRHCINTCNLTNLGFKGSIFTWWNGRVEEDCIFKRLDRFLANMEFQQMLPGIEITDLSKIGSDHSPMMLSCNTATEPVKKAFRFLNFWTKYPTFIDVVKENWQADFAGDPFIIFNHKLKRLKKALSTWSRATYGDIFQKISSLEEVVLVHEAQFERHPTYQNTKFFHALVNGRRKRLQLKRIQNIYGNWLEDKEAIVEEAVNFFKAQFYEDRVPDSFGIIDHVPMMVGTEQNEELVR